MNVTDLIAAIAPAYVSDSRIAAFTTIAEGRTNRKRFGKNYEFAVALRVCHMICRNPSDEPGTPGAVTGAQEKAVSQQYKVSDDLMRRYSDLCSTPYGAQLAELIDGHTIGIVVAGGPMGFQPGR
ncbi:MAG TPA: DUF4054 domain-containing protein [Chitinivibrionales bacterium]|nr:DUF4054 domain-containing protein [Chitinivibrionales bacterium]